MRTCWSSLFQGGVDNDLCGAIVYPIFSQPIFHLPITKSFIMPNYLQHPSPLSITQQRTSQFLQTLQRCFSSAHLPTVCFIVSSSQSRQTMQHLASPYPSPFPLHHPQFSPISAMYLFKYCGLVILIDLSIYEPSLSPVTFPRNPQSLVPLHILRFCASDERIPQ